MGKLEAAATNGDELRKERSPKSEKMSGAEEGDGLERGFVSAGRRVLKDLWGLLYIGVVVLMRLGAFVGFVRRSAFMCGKNF